MRILLTGATGFIGSRLLEALLARGHRVVMVSRRETMSGRPGVQHISRDFAHALNPSDWVGAVQDIDVVINAVGILREQRGQRFDALHHRAPAALFQAAAAAGVRRIVQISALGADEAATTAYHLSKKAADDVLTSLPVEGIIVQPSLVFGPGGASATMFSTQASQPVIPLPGKGGQMVQPIHIDDLVELVVSLATEPIAESGRESRRLAAVGPEAISLRKFYGRLRRALGVSAPARYFNVPMWAMRLLAWLGQWVPGSPLDPDTLSMLERGNAAPATDTEAILGHAPRGVDAFVHPGYRADVSLAARLRWLAPILRVSVALVWLAAGIVSLGLYPVSDSMAMLEAVGVPSVFSSAVLYCAAAMDIALGLLVLSPWRGRWLWAFQALVVLGYTAILTLRLPDFWLHPFGPLVKNLPFLAVLWLLYEVDRKP
ncbi:MAG TPA: SDR family oxidoreductase [Burkholderiaceae bacterium]|nr:SDR family oxidoreductase [Burkholderiaceae bacterium]